MAAFSLCAGLCEANITQLKWSEVCLEKEDALTHTVLHELQEFGGW